MNRVDPFLAWIWREEKGISNVLRFPLTVVSWLYGAVVRTRISFYEKGWISRKKVDAHVVSMGNLTTGGTGKTPLTLYFAEQWQKRGVKVGIVSRGYRRPNESHMVVVSEGQGPLAGPEVTGDEPYLMAERLTGVPIVVSADRFTGCQNLINRFGVEIILLDDAFQHLKLHRDMNVLVIDATNPFGNGFLLPRGCLREPVSAIERADCIVLSRVDDGVAMDRIMEEIAPFQKPVFQSGFEAVALIDLKTGKQNPVSILKGMKILSFCGIGNPDAFLSQLRNLGADIQLPFVFKDHHVYEKADMLNMTAAAKDKGVQKMVTTEKDAVKIKAFVPDNIAVFALRIGLAFSGENEENFSRLFAR